MSLKFKNEHAEKQIFRARLGIAFMVVLLAWALLCARLLQLQYVEHQRYAELAKNNSINTQPLQPPRGLILDRNGIVLAKNEPSFQLSAVREQTEMPPEALVAALARIVDLDDGEQLLALKRLQRARSFEPVVITSILTEKQVASFMSAQYKFKGISVEASLRRDYPLKEDFAHTVGYMGPINERELATLEKSVHAGNSFIGKNGIEQYYQSLLVGERGFVEVEVDAGGRKVAHHRKQPPVPGADLILTLDARIQNFVIEEMADRRGAVVLMDPKNGDILSLVSHPSYDPNGFVRGWDTASYAALQNSPDKPLFNRVLQGRYPAASTIKPFLALAGLEDGVIDKDTTISDPGWYQIEEDTRVYRDWKPSGHGKVNVLAGIAQSCDTFFYYLAHKMGIDSIATWLDAYGFGQKTQVDLPNEHKGLVPSREWKMQKLGEKWYTGETLNTGIGQGYFQVTPLQLAVATSTLAMRGKRTQPHLLKATRWPDDEVIPFQSQSLKPMSFLDKNVDLIFEAMQATHGWQRGTARQMHKDLQYTLAGKTGTAQVYGLKADEKYIKDEVQSHLRDHTLFVGFAPVEDPKVVIAIISENRSGTARIARKILDRFFELEGTVR